MRGRRGREAGRNAQQPLPFVPTGYLKEVLKQSA